MTTYFPSNQRDAMLGEQKLGSSCQEPPFCSANLMMFMNQDPSEIFSGVSSTPPSNFVESMDDRNQLGFNPPVMGILEDSNFQSQSVSLSLATQPPPMASMASFPPQYQSPAMASFMNSSLPIFEKRPNSVVCKSDESIRPDVKNGVYSCSTLNSVYIEAAQQLLDEMVSVREALKELRSKKYRDSNGKENDGGCYDLSAERSSDAGESIANPSRDLLPAERQDLKNKNSKLLSLTGEVDRRYKQYYQQVQLLASSFDAVAGRGTAEFYTTLAHRTISCHFRRLRDAITAQIEVTRRALGEQDISLSGQEGIPRLRFVDRQLRQQRALQHLGVTQHCWRPQRGLPESSVSILRAWLFEHFLHPYPKDSEKLKLARQTGLTRNQVANWFINARVRLWKPMVEEMYKEEFGDSNSDFKSSPENAFKASWNNSFLSEDRGDMNGERVLYRSCSNDDMKSGSFSVGGDISLALELKRCEGDGFAVYSSSNMESSNGVVGSVELESQCRLMSSNMLHDFVI